MTTRTAPEAEAMALRGSELLNAMLCSMYEHPSPEVSRLARALHSALCAEQVQVYIVVEGSPRLEYFVGRDTGHTTGTALVVRTEPNMVELLIHYDLERKIHENPIGEVGHLVHLASVLLDHQHGRLVDHVQEAKERGRMFVAEYLVRTPSVAAGIVELGPWMRQAMNDWPLGVRTPGAERFIYHTGIVGPAVADA